jgi:hypothetical protein
MIKIYPDSRNFTLAALVVTCLTSAFSRSKASPELNALASWVSMQLWLGTSRYRRLPLKTMPSGNVISSNLMCEKGEW